MKSSNLTTEAILISSLSDSFDQITVNDCSGYYRNMLQEINSIALNTQVQRIVENQSAELPLTESLITERQT